MPFGGVNSRLAKFCCLLSSLFPGLAFLSRRRRVLLSPPKVHEVAASASGARRGPWPTGTHGWSSVPHEALRTTAPCTTAAGVAGMTRPPPTAPACATVTRTFLLPISPHSNLSSPPSEATGVPSFPPLASISVRGQVPLFCFQTLCMEFPWMKPSKLYSYLPSGWEVGLL